MSSIVTPKDFSSIWKDLAASAKKKFGADVDLSPHTPLGVLLEMVAYQSESIWLSLEHVSSSLFVSLSSGYYLDSLVALRGVTRNLGAPAQVTLTFTGLPQTMIPQNTLVQHYLDKTLLFSTTERTFLSSQGIANVVAQSLKKGIKQNVPVKTLSICLSPIEGVFSVVNHASAVQGMDVETDEQLKNRFFNIFATTSTSVLGLINAFSALQHAEYVQVLENASNQESDTLPPKSIHVIVSGPSDIQVAQTLYQHKPAGIATYGNTATTYRNQSYQFSRPQKKSLHIKISIAKCAVSQDTWNQSGASTLKQSLKDWLSPPNNPIALINQPVDAKTLAQRFASHPLVEQGVTVVLGSSSDDVSHSSVSLLPYEYPFVESNHIDITVREYAV